jgi:hypothetical protein
MWCSVISYKFTDVSEEHTASSFMVKELDEPWSLNDEWEFLRDNFTQNGYSKRQILKALNLPVSVAPPKYTLDSVAFLPHVGSTFNPLALAKNQVEWLSAEENLWFSLAS